MAFDLKDYIEVNVRVDKFWKMYPNGRIATEIISFENGVIVMKASIYKKAEAELPDATGHAYEKEDSTFINKTSAVENCETSAVGRALGVMGFEIKKAIALKEEVANAIHQQEQDKKSVLKPTQIQPSGNDFDWSKLDLNKVPKWELSADKKPITPPIIKRLFAIQRNYGISADDYKMLCVRVSNKEHNSQWTYGDIKKIEEELNRVHDENNKEAEKIIDEPEEFANIEDATTDEMEELLQEKFPGIKETPQSEAHNRIQKAVGKVAI